MKGAELMDIQVGDTLKMKKEHPCGSKEMLVLRVGADFKLKCAGCGRDFIFFSHFERGVINSRPQCR